MQLCFKDAPAKEWDELFPDASPEAIDLLRHLVQWNPGKSSRTCLSLCLVALIFYALHSKWCNLAMVTYR